MAKWLVTVAPNQLQPVAERLRQLGCEVTPEAVVPVDGDSVIPVSGPESLRRAIAKVPGVKSVHPDSDLTLY